MQQIIGHESNGHLTDSAENSGDDAHDTNNMAENEDNGNLYAALPLDEESSDSENSTPEHDDDGGCEPNVELNRSPPDCDRLTTQAVEQITNAMRRLPVHLFPPEAS